MRVARDISDRLKVIDARIVVLSAQGYAVEVDRLLEERQELQGWLSVLALGVLARS